MQKPIAPEQQASETVTEGLSRRRFMQYAGGLAGAGIFLAACSKNNNDLPDTSVPGVDKDGTIRFGSGDVGMLNYFYAVKQMEAAFYTRIIDNPYKDMPVDEMLLLTDMRDHKIAQREFYKRTLGSNAIPEVSIDFPEVNFATRAGTLQAAKRVEDIIVSAYNGAIVLFSSSDTILLIAKISSVASRHAAYIRDVMSYGSFADSTAIDANGMDLTRKPNEVLAEFKTFITNKFDTSHLPNA